MSSQRLLEAETKQKSREVKDTQTLRMWCVERATSIPVLMAKPSEVLVLAREFENYILGRVVT